MAESTAAREVDTGHAGNRVRDGCAHTPGVLAAMLTFVDLHQRSDVRDVVDADDG
jgi:hypothetical protein